MISIANPIYDVVFKYLMEDERIARTILSALLKKDIVHVEMRPHEFINDKGTSLTMLRIDFGATVREADGSEHLVLIELQKTWVETETLRFRQYLGLQYENPRNMADDGKHAVPMVAVYLLGHRVGDIEEPVLYVNHHAMDYNDQPVTKGMPNPFVESLTHSSIIVQIPLLHGHVHNRLERLLSIFDQTQKDSEDFRILKIDDTKYSDDVEMERIITRLTQAAASSEMRRRINIEAEFMSVIERRETEILNRDYELAKQKVQLEEQNAQLEEQHAQLEEQSAQLEEQSAQLEEQSAQLEEQSAQLEEQSAQLEEQNAQLEEQSAQLRKSVQMLYKASLSPEDIAAQLGMDLASVQSLLK